MPVAFAQTLSKFNSVCGVAVEELSEFWQDRSSLLLKHVQRQVEYFFSDVDGICDNNNFWGFLRKDSIVDPTSYGEEFSFRESNIDCAVESFDHRFVEDMDMHYGRGDIVFDTGISLSQEYLMRRKRIQWLRHWAVECEI